MSARPKRRPAAVLLLGLGLVVFSPAARAEDAPSGTGLIFGRVVNGSFSDRPQPGLEVVLEAVYKDQPEPSRRLEADAEGRFSFERLPVDPERSFTISTRHGEVAFAVDRIVLTGAEPAAQVPLRVYERSADGSRVVASRLHLIVDAYEEGLRVQEVYQLRNDLPNAYIGSEPLRFDLPRQARNVGISSGLDSSAVEVRDGSVLARLPVSPVGETIAYRYDLPVGGRSYRLQRTLAYPAEQVDVFLSVPGAELKAERLQPGEPLVLDGANYQRLSGKDLEAGLPLEFLFDGLPGGGIRFLRDLVVALSLLAVSAALIYGLLVKGRTVVPGRPPAGRDAGLLRSRGELLREIAALDDAFGGGELAEPEYGLQRNLKKRRLAEVTLRLEGEDPPAWNGGP